ncbi:hypothetical protein HK104_001523 [Borealophlyctis nickersoniae]|nr:hypothetical protein HK104_001523 [Borealophlyctis nickersoniae]
MPQIIQSTVNNWGLPWKKPTRESFKWKFRQKSSQSPSMELLPELATMVLSMAWLGLRQMVGLDTVTTHKSAALSLMSPAIYLATSIPAADNHTSLPSLTIRIDYRLNDPEAGLYFVFPDDEVAPQRHPHMYTHNQASFTRFWMPCIDKSQERCTWEIYCIVPASERDALSPRQRENLTTEAGEDELPMIAVCSGTLIEQSELPDPRKRLFSFLVETPVAASSILLAVGPFQQVPIESWTKKTGQPPQVPEEDSFDYLLDESEDAEPVGYSFCLPGREDEVAYTTEFLGEAAEFLENYLGTSYPFPSYQQVFMEDTFSPLSTGSGINFFSSHLLLRSDVIDQTYESRRLMCRALAMQWIVHYIPPKTWADVWLTTGLAYYITGLFLEKHFGTNEYKYRLKKDMSRVCELDVHQPPLYPVVPSDLDGLPPGPKMIDPLMLPHYHPDDTWSSLRSEFLTLKAPIVIHMLDVRMGKGVVQTVIKKILVSAMSGELPAGLSTHHFLKVARKISEKPEIKTFADQWIYASGCPRFSFQYHFNARKMVLQFKFSQQSTSKGDFGSAPKFTGSFTLRVHGPVDTVDREIHIENTQQSFEIVYNNDMVGRRARKKSLKKARSVLGAADDMADEIDIPDAGVNDGVFEWIRIDPDNEWLCVKEFEQTDYMWAQQLRKDRDVVAQLEVRISF